MNHMSGLDLQWHSDKNLIEETTDQKKMTDLNDLKEQKCVAHTKGMDAHEFGWLTLMVASERSRARDMFEGVFDQELDNSQRAILDGLQPLLTPQEEERLRAENNRAHPDLSKVLPSELEKL